MALQKTTKFLGIEIVDAYHRVDNIQTNGKNFITATINSYKSNSEPQPFTFMQISCPYDLECSDNVFKQAYNHIKKQDAFDGAVDC